MDKLTKREQVALVFSQTLIKEYYELSNVVAREKMDVWIERYKDMNVTVADCIIKEAKHYADIFVKEFE